MGKINVPLPTLFVALIIFNFGQADPEVNSILVNKKSVDVISRNNSNVDDKAGAVNKAENEIGVKGGVEKSKTNSKLNSDKNGNSTNKLEVREDVNGQKAAKGDGFQEESDDTDSKNENGRKSLPLIRKESSRGEECDSSSISCIDDKKALVACLRVPGNESPEFSLLIQNKGKGTLGIKISAPDFVKLEKEQLQVHKKEDKKVRVAIKGVGPDNFIVLTAGNGNCSLDFKDLIVHSSGKQVNSDTKFTYIHHFKRTPFFGLILLAAVILIASPWMCIKFRRSQIKKEGIKYEKINMELPVSSGSKSETGLNDEWDDSWGDSWDDEEAPKTPSMPVTPSLSSKGIASRRLSKEGWKD